MNLIEALREADGKKVSRKAWSPNMDCWFLECGQLKTTYGNAEPHTCKDNLLADDWYVVEPKSKIDEAIEREVADYFGVSPMESHRSQVAEAMRRVVNLALDEAKKCNKQTFCEICEKQFAERIDALKVKE